MKKKRYLPFVYRMIGGRIEIISEESDLVQNIFCSYLAGASLQQLAKLAEQTGLHFRENANAWNKNMISRILDDKRYWQKGLFPAIIQEELALQVSELKSSKASTKTPLHFLQKKISIAIKIVSTAPGKPHDIIPPTRRIRITGRQPT